VGVRGWRAKIPKPLLVTNPSTEAELKATEARMLEAYQGWAVAIEIALITALGGLVARKRLRKKGRR